MLKSERPAIGAGHAAEIACLIGAGSRGGHATAMPASTGPTGMRERCSN